MYMKAIYNYSTLKSKINKPLKTFQGLYIKYKLNINSFHLKQHHLKQMNKEVS